MASLWTRLRQRLTASTRRASSKCPASSSRRMSRFESLEERRMMTRQVILDFDGEDLTSAEMSQGGWGGYGAQKVPAFSEIFTSDRTWLDVDKDGQVNFNDAQLVISRIMAKVREDYAPFDVNIAFGDQDAYQSMLSDGQHGDAIVIISGGLQHIGNVPAYGLSPWTDLGNEHDEIAWAFGEEITHGEGSSFHSVDMLVNQFAFCISHELGHCFGLGHIANDSPLTDARSHNMMAEVGRSFNADFTFQDITYPTNTMDGSNPHSTLHPEFNTADQNSFQYLSHPAVLGPSSGTWMAALKPGELTIHGDATSNRIDVTQPASGRWSLTMTSAIFGQSRTAIAEINNNASVNSLYPYADTVQTIKIYGHAGDDTITVSDQIFRQVLAWGDDGNDVIIGGRGNDFLYGGIGNDTLVGGRGTDYLYGQWGDDTLQGDSYFDDGVVDYLNGGIGVDTFYQQKNDPTKPVVYDYFADFDLREDKKASYSLNLG